MILDYNNRAGKVAVIFPDNLSKMSFKTVGRYFIDS